MRVKVVRSFGLGGGGVAEIGEVHDLPEAMVRQWIKTGRVNEVPVEVPVGASLGGLVTQDVEPENREPELPGE